MFFISLSVQGLAAYGGVVAGAFDPGDALLLDDGVSFLLLGGGTDKLLLAPQ